MSGEEVLELAGLQCAVENREYDESQHTPDSMKWGTGCTVNSSNNKHLALKWGQIHVKVR